MAASKRLSSATSEADSARPVVGAVMTAEIGDVLSGWTPNKTAAATIAAAVQLLTGSHRGTNRDLAVVAAGA
jgi:hypothetical protein